MSKTVPATTDAESYANDGAWATLCRCSTPAGRFAAGQFAITPVPVPGFLSPVPPMFFDLPWADDNEATVAGILAGLAAADDIAAATESTDLVDPADLVGSRIEVLGISARKSALTDATWGAYLALTCSVDGGPPQVVNTGAGEVCVVMWRCWCEGVMPVTGTFVLRGSAREGRSQPLGFQIERPL
jgi:hypothetical protein